jgi:hypothetical protein
MSNTDDHNSKAKSKMGTTITLKLLPEYKFKLTPTLYDGAHVEKINKKAHESLSHEK